MLTAPILVSTELQLPLKQVDTKVVRSVIAHTYLQLARILTVNNSNRWMFQEADSAGCFVESEFTREHRREIGEYLVPPRLPAYKALAAMAKRQRFASREKDDIMKRMQSRVTQGLKVSRKVISTIGILYYTLMNRSVRFYGP